MLDEIGKGGQLEDIEVSESLQKKESFLKVRSNDRLRNNPDNTNEGDLCEITNKGRDTFLLGGWVVEAYV